MEGVLTMLGRIAGAVGLGVGYGLFFPLIFTYSLSISYTHINTVYFGLFRHSLLASAPLSHSW